MLTVSLCMQEIEKNANEREAVYFVNPAPLASIPSVSLRLFYLLAELSANILQSNVPKKAVVVARRRSNLNIRLNAFSIQVNSQVWPIDCRFGMLT